MTTVNTIITRAMRLIGVLGDGEALSASEAADGLLALNAMWDSWAIEKNALYKIDTVSYAPTAASFTIGATGALVTPRPVEILSAYYRINGIDTPVAIVSREQYEDVSNKAAAGTLYGIYYKPTYPDGTVYCWQIPAGATLYMSCQQPFTAFAALTDNIALPPGYQEALTFNLAVLFAPEFDTEAPATVQRKAASSKRLLKTVNAEIPQLQNNPMLYAGSGRGWSIQ